MSLFEAKLKSLKDKHRELTNEQLRDELKKLKEVKKKKSSKSKK